MVPARRDHDKACHFGRHQLRYCYTVARSIYERLKESPFMKPLKGTKARKPKPHSKGGRRAAVAKAARRPTPATRGQHSRAEVKRGVAAKAAAEASAARLGKSRGPG